MTRDEWKARSRAFERSAVTLLANGHYDVAYHLAGIAVECALKARISTLFRKHDIPDKKLVENIYREGHDLTALVKHGDLVAGLAAEEAASVAFHRNWEVVKTWNVNSRYQVWSKQQATDMVDAVKQRQTGVLSWIRRHW